jgi:hypothetical protein
MEKVEAVLSTIVDIVDAEAVCPHQADMAAVLGIVLEAMRLHPGECNIQHHGCQCVALLVPIIPQLADLPLASQAVIAVLSAARRFPRRFIVLQGMCESLRELCSLLRPTHASEALVATLRSQDAVPCIEQLLDDYTNTALSEGDNNELVEHAVVVLVILVGVENALSRVSAAEPSSMLRCAGLKGIYEACRLDMSVLSGGISSSVAAVVATMVAEEPVDGTGRLSQFAALLVGACGSSATLANVSGAPTPLRSRGLLE